MLTLRLDLLAPPRRALGIPSNTFSSVYHYLFILSSVGKSKRVGGKESAEAGDQAAVYVDGGDVLKSKAERKGGAAPASADRRDGVEQEGQEDGQDESGKVAARRWSRYRSGSYAMEAEGEDDVKDDEDGALADGEREGQGFRVALSRKRGIPILSPSFLSRPGFDVVGVFSSNNSLQL